jgi:hypothetical protein
MTAAAGGQRWVICGIEGEREWSQTEDENEQDGEDAPHLGLCYMNSGGICLRERM